MQEILQRIENLENQVANIKLTLIDMIQQSSENEKQNLEGYKRLAQVVEMLSLQLQGFSIIDRKKLSFTQPPFLCLRQAGHEVLGGYHLATCLLCPFLFCFLILLISFYVHFTVVNGILLLWNVQNYVIIMYQEREVHICHRLDRLLI